MTRIRSVGRGVAPAAASTFSSAATAAAGTLISGDAAPARQDTREAMLLQNRTHSSGPPPGRTTPMPDRPVLRRSRWALLHAVAVVAVMALSAVALAAPGVHGVGDDAPSIQRESPALLRTDDGGDPMFRLANLGGGERQVQCITVTSRAGHPVPLGMSAESNGTLGQYLRLTIDAGVGGRFDDCDGFVGSQIYGGTLARFAASHFSAGSALPAGDAAPGMPVVFRLALETIDVPDAQSQSTSAAFAWHTLGSRRPGPTATADADGSKLSR